MKLPVYPIGRVLSAGTSPPSAPERLLHPDNLPKSRNSQTCSFGMPPLKPDPDMEKRLNDPLIQYYIKFILPKFCKSDKKSYFW